MIQFSKRLVSLVVFAILVSCGDDSPEPKLKSCFEVAAAPTAGVPIQFNAACSTNETDYLWDFAGLGTSTLPNPTFTFATPGTYAVKLKVSDGTNDHTSSQNVVVQAPGSTAACTVSHPNTFLKVSETWKTGEVHCINGYFQVEAGATLTIQPGVTVRFAKGKGITVWETGSALIAEGTVDQPIVFTSAEASPAAGDWTSLLFDGNDTGASKLKYCILQYGGNTFGSSFGENVGMVDIRSGGHVSIDNSTFRKSLSHAAKLDIYSSFGSFTNNTITEAGDYAIFAHPINAHTIGAGNTITNKGIWLDNAAMNIDATWLKQTCPYYVYDLEIGSTLGNTLTLSPGVELRMAYSYSEIYVAAYGSKGKLVAQGTASEKIKFTTAAAAPTPGAWGGLQFDPGTLGGTILDNVIIEYADGDDATYAAVDIFSNNVQITNTTISNVKGMGISLDYSTSRGFATFTNNTITTVSTAYPLKMSAVKIQTIGDGNTLSGKAIYIWGGQLADVQSIRWRSFGIPYLVDGNITMGSPTYADHTVTIDAGCIFKFTPNSGLTIANSNNTKFMAVGTALSPIVFTSAQVSPAPGDWDGIEIYNRIVSGSKMDYCKVEYGGGRYANVSVVSISTPGIPAITNCAMNYSERYGFYSFQSSATLTNNTYANNVLGATSIQ